MSLIQTKQSSKYPNLSVHKYKKKVFYNNLWKKDPKLLESRGHVYNDKGILVVNPFTKIFNYGENGTTIPDNEECLVVEKINGFMACATWVPEVNDVVVSTTGSLDSPYVDMAKEMLPNVINYLKEEKPDETFIFEIIHPNDPHIIPETSGAYLLGMRNPIEKESYFSTEEDEELLDRFALAFGVIRPFYFVTSFKKAKDRLQNIKFEGFVVYGQESKTVLKLKSPYYKTKKLLARKKEILSLDKRAVDEEYYPLLDHVKSLGETFTNWSEQERLDYMRNWLHENP